MVTTHTLKYIHAHMCTQICGGDLLSPLSLLPSVREKKEAEGMTESVVCVP